MNQQHRQVKSLANWRHHLLTLALVLLLAACDVWPMSIVLLFMAPLWWLLITTVLMATFAVWVYSWFRSKIFERLSVEA